ncbi:MAG: 16S rRNA processing protein RimM [Bacilli bacterium]|nr:16S rRNA processing protein RimM [Bacilli bacterium]MBN2877749.1 16S rRNA processing protein RimM [Bacilli bacterium]
MEYIKIGTIVNTKGIRGELKVQSFTDFQEDRYRTGNTIYIFYDNEYLPFQVKAYSPYKNQDLLVLKDHEDINLVEKFKGSDVYVPEEAETTLFEDEYHVNELLELDVYQNSNLVGTIANVVAYPQGDYLDILQESGKHSLVPFRDEFVLEVNLDEGYVEIIEMEGLL